MNSELIQHLSKNLKPVRPARTPIQQSMILILLSIFIVAFACLFWYLRKDEFHIPQGRSLLESVLLFLAASYGIYQACLSTSPHFTSIRFSKKSVVFLILWFFVLILSFLSLYFLNQEESLIALKYNTWLCPLVILTSSIPISIISYFFVQRGAVLFARNTFLYLSLASLCFGAFGLSFICPWTDPLHEILWHLTPVLLLTIGIAALQIVIFKKIQKYFKG